MKSVFINLHGDTNMSAAYLHSLIDKAGFDITTVHFRRLGYEIDPPSQIELDTLKKCVDELNPDVIMMSVNSMSFWTAVEVGKLFKDQTIIFGGVQPMIDPERCLKYVDIIVRGEGDEAIIELLSALENNKPIDKIKNVWCNKKGKIIKNDFRPLVKNLDILPFPDYTDKNKLYVLGSATHQSNPLPHSKYTYNITFSRGCPFNCLSGDTLINTVEGKIPIKKLVKRKNIGVYTYDPKTKNIFITNAFDIRKTKSNVDIVRVLFDDGTHIDCTPDHKFLTFKNGNQYCNTKEIEKEAKDLKQNESVRAIRFDKNNGYIDVVWGRRKRYKNYRMVMEYILGRKLLKSEQVHHKNKNRMDDSIKNLKFCKNSNYRKDLKNSTIEKLRGKGLSYKKIAKKLNCNVATVFYRLNKYQTKEINHKIVSVTPIGKSDVYNMEVPATHWFFANNVLVHNCTYCLNHFLNREFKYKYLRKRSVQSVIAELKEAKRLFPHLTDVSFWDDVFLTDIVWLREFVKEYKEHINLPFFAYGNANFVTEESMKLLKEAGISFFDLGLQSGSEHIRRNIFGRTDTNAAILKADSIINKNKITVGYDLIFSEFETEETIEDGINFLLQLKKPFKVQRNKLAYYPNFDISKMALKQGLIKEEDIASVSDKVNTQIMNTNESNKQPLMTYFYFLGRRFVPNSFIKYMLNHKWHLTHPKVICRIGAIINKYENTMASIGGMFTLIKKGEYRYVYNRMFNKGEFVA